MKTESKRLYGSSTVFKRKDGYWTYQTYSFHKSSGSKKKKVSKYLGKKTKGQALALQKEWDRFYDEIDEGGIGKNPFQKPPQPLSYLRDVYIKELEKKLKVNETSDTTYRMAKDNTRLFVEWYLKEYGDKQIFRITTEEIDQYHEHRKFKKHNGNYLAANTIRINLKEVRTFFKWCVKDKVLEVSPFTSDIEIPKYNPRPDEEVPMGEDWNKLYSFMDRSMNFVETKTKEKQRLDWFNKNTWFKQMIWVLCNTAMRSGEVRILKWERDRFDDTSKKKSFAYIDRNMEKFCIFFKGSYGEIVIPKKLMPLLKEMKKNRGKNVYLWQSPRTDIEYGKGDLNKNFKRLMVELGLVDNKDGEPLYKPHSIRHSVVADLISKNVNIYVISKILRHKDIRTTLNIYGHLIKGGMEEAMNLIGEPNDNKNT